MPTIPNKLLIASIKLKCIFLNEYKFEISESKNGQNDCYAAAIYRLIHFVKYSHPCS